jgi:LacI family transcriptional regulator
MPCHVFPAFDSEKSGRSHTPASDLAAWLQSLPKPIGIFAPDDQTARDLAVACRQLGLQVPDEIAIVGANNDDLLCESAWPPLSSVEIDFARIGYLAARQLDRLLSAQSIEADDRKIRLPPRGVARRQITDLLAVDDPDVARAVAFIRANACGPFTVSDLLREVPLVRRTLERRFMEKLGRTPYEEITRVRMDMAQRLLRETEETLPRIAERCGFCTPQALNYVFRKVVGNTPAAYRRLHRGSGH